MIRHFLAGIAALAVGAGAAAYAEDVNVNINSPDARVKIEGNEQPYGQPMLFVMGGGNNSLRDLDPAFDSTFETGYNLGGGIGIQLNRSVAIRASYTFARSQGDRDNLFSPLAGNHFNRHYYGADLQFRAFNDSGLSPYLFLGGGAVTVAPGNDALIVSPSGVSFSNDSFTKPAARAGIGLEYQVPNSGLGLYAEGAGWAYKWDRYGFDRMQYDTNWGGGITYRFGY
jgi:hypothetical protein